MGRRPPGVKSCMALQGPSWWTVRPPTSVADQASSLGLSGPGDAQASWGVSTPGQGWYTYTPTPSLSSSGGTKMITEFHSWKGSQPLSGIIPLHRGDQCHTTSRAKNRSQVLASFKPALFLSHFEHSNSHSPFYAQPWDSDFIFNPSSIPQFSSE